MAKAKPKSRGKPPLKKKQVARKKPVSSRKPKESAAIVLPATGRGVTLQPLRKTDGEVFQLRLGSLRSAKQTYSRLLKVMATGSLDFDTARFWVYALAGFLQYCKLEDSQLLEGRIEALEKILRGETDEHKTIVAS